MSGFAVAAEGAKSVDIESNNLARAVPPFKLRWRNQSQLHRVGRRRTVITPPIAILKALWARENGSWAISGIKGLELKPKAGFEPDYFPIDSRIELLSEGSFANLHQVMAAVGPTDFLLKQSIVPIVSWKMGDPAIRCIGTGTLISCSGYILTAAHVLMDPPEAGYGVTWEGNNFTIDDDLNFGAFIPVAQPFGPQGILFLPFETTWVWGHWKESPLVHERARFEYLTDIALCKIAQMPNGIVHQPFNMSLNPFAIGEAAYSIGYAEMEDIPLTYENGKIRIAKHRAELFVSIGEVTDLFPQNHLQKAVTAPGPCFTFKARIPGGMSGAPVFGANGAVVRGVVSKSWSDDRDATGAMLRPAMSLPLDATGATDRTLLSMMKGKVEGIAQVHGIGL